MVIPVPAPLYKTLRWKEGDVLQMAVDEEGTAIISKKRGGDYHDG